MKLASREFGWSWQTVVIAVALSALACGPERPPAPAPPASTTPSPAAAAGRKDLPPSAYRIEWSPVSVPDSLKPGEAATVAVTLQNISTTTWPASGQGEMYVVRLSHRWLRASGELVADFGDRRAELPGPVAPGGSVTVDAALVAPAAPGNYVVQFDLVHEGVAWFSERGAAKQFAPVRVK